MSMTTKTFPDLRIKEGATQINDESVWPSFTDIMTVITMVFMMAMVVIAIRNAQLDSQLAQTSSVNENLDSRIHHLETALAQTGDLLQESNLKNKNLNLQINDLSQLLIQENQEKQALESKNIDAAQQIASLQSQLTQQRELERQQIAELNQLLTQAGQEKQALESQNFNAVQQIASLQTQLTQQRELGQQQIAALNQLLIQADQEKQALESKNIDIAQQVESLQKEITAALKTQETLQKEYSDLDERYQDLIKPARSSVGKYTVTIYIEKHDGKVGYKYKLPNDAESADISKEALFTELEELKQQQGSNLYTKTIVNENSQLTYGEGLKLIQEILNKFDYYYQ